MSRGDLHIFDNLIKKSSTSHNEAPAANGAAQERQASSGRNSSPDLARGSLAQASVPSALGAAAPATDTKWPVVVPPPPPPSLRRQPSHSDLREQLKAEQARSAGSIADRELNLDAPVRNVLPLGVAPTLPAVPRARFDGPKDRSPAAATNALGDAPFDGSDRDSAWGDPSITEDAALSLQADDTPTPLFAPVAPASTARSTLPHGFARELPNGSNSTAAALAHAPFATEPPMASDAGSSQSATATAGQRLLAAAPPLPLSSTPEAPAWAPLPQQSASWLAKTESSAPSATDGVPLLRSTKRTLWYVALVAMLLGAALTLLLFKPQTGSVLVAVSGPGAEPLAKVAIFLDGTLRCERSPCAIKDVGAGSHLLSVEAPGFASTAPQAIVVEPGQEAAQNLVLTQSSARGELKVLGSARQTLIIDGNVIGSLPQESLTLSPGEHELVILSGDRFEPYRERIQATHQLQTIGPITPKVATGLLVLTGSASTKGARVEVDGRRIALPATLELSGGESHQLVATRKGFEDYERAIVFLDGNAEQHLLIELSEAKSGRARQAAATTNTPTATGPNIATISPEKTQPPASAGATLNINSMPASAIFINGRPVGQTPKMGVAVNPGSAVVMFIHPVHGRKLVTVEAEAGASKTVTVRFP